MTWSALLEALLDEGRSVATHFRVALMADVARVWAALGFLPRAEAVLNDAAALWETVSPLVRRVEAAVTWAEAARALGYEDRARAMLERAADLLPMVTDPESRAAGVETLLAAWPGPGLPAALQDASLWSDLEEDPWAEVAVTVALLRAVLQGEAMPSHGSAAVDTLFRRWLAWDAPFMAAALVDHANLLAHPRTRGWLPAFAHRARGMTMPLYRAQACAALARAAAPHAPALARDLAVWAQEAAADAAAGLPRVESRAYAAWGMAAVDPEAARDLLRAVVADLPTIGYMDDRVRVMHRAMATTALLREATVLPDLWAALRDVGFPRFYAPAAATLVRLARDLGATDLAQTVLDHTLAWAEHEAHTWKRLILFQHLLPLWTREEEVARASRLLLSLTDPNEQGHALALLAPVWARYRPQDLPELLRRGQNLPAGHGRALALEALVRAWHHVDGRTAREVLVTVLPLLPYPHRKARLLAEVLAG